MSMHQNTTTIRRSLGARADAIDIAIKVMSGTLSPKTIPQSQRTETIERLRQGQEFIGACIGYERQIADIINGGEK
jgi:hypothetical protein